MLDDKDIQKIIEANKETFAAKQDIAVIKADIKDIKSDVSGLRESVQSLILSVDKLVKVMEDSGQESASATLKIDRHEKWIQQIAEKIGVQLKY